MLGYKMVKRILDYRNLFQYGSRSGVLVGSHEKMSHVSETEISTSKLYILMIVKV